MEVAARCDPILQRTPEMGGVERGVGADPTDSHRMVAVGSGGAQIKEGGGAPGVSLQTDHRGVILHPWDRD